MPPTRLRVDGTEVLVEGRGEEVVLMPHGWPDTRALWDGLIDVLKDRFVCARLTLPACDETQPQAPRTLDAMTALLRAVLDRISPDRPVTLVLHDWGCVFGYELAMWHPEWVARVIGVDVGDHSAPALWRS